MPWYEKQGDGSLIQLNVEGEYVDAAVGTIPLQVSYVGDPALALTPLAPSVTTAAMDSRTQATIGWTAPSNTGRPPITAYNIYREDNGGDATLVGTVDDLVFTFTNTSLPTDTPEIIFGYTVRAVNADGIGDWSNKALIQWNGTPTPQPPTAPTNLAYSNVTQTTVVLTWAEVLDTSVTKHGIYQNNVLIRDNLDPLAVSYTLTGLTVGTAYSNIDVRRFNAEGWSPASNKVSFTTAGSSSGITQDPVMGQSVPTDENAYLTQIDAIRVYNDGDVIPRFNTYAPRVIAFTDDSYSANGTSLAYVDAVEVLLENFYYGSGSTDRQNCELHIANGNEIDRSWTTGSLSAAFIAVYAALRDLIHTTTGGNRRYPRASVWVDMTANNVRTAGAGPRFKPIARYLDGFAASFYPAGRTISATNPLIEYDPDGYPAGSIWSGNSRNAYSFFCDPLMDALADWRATGSAVGGSLVGQLDQVACWEIGIPIHHSLSGLNLTTAVRTGADATDLTQRPRYLTGGAKTSGAAGTQYNFKGFLQYVYDRCVADNVSMREMLYWNQQSNPDIPNKWFYDRNLTSPDSVTAWNNWTPGTRLPNA